MADKRAMDFKGGMHVTCGGGCVTIMGDTSLQSVTPLGLDTLIFLLCWVNDALKNSREGEGLP